LDPFQEADDERIWKALELAHLKTAVSGYDKKLEHEINENGSNLRYFFKFPAQKYNFLKKCG